MRRTATATVFLLAVLVLLPACSTNPATGRRQLNVISEQREIEIGSQAQPEFIQGNGGELPSEPVLSEVRRVGHSLAAVSEREQLPWEFHVINSAQINAFALPGGKVFMSRGLLEQMDNEAQLAGVLGHEVGHVTGKHVNDRMANQLIITGLAIGLGVAGAASDEDWLTVLGVGVGVGGTVYQLQFSQSQELEADALGVRYMARVGYNPVAQIQVMEILKRAAGTGEGSFFSTHPGANERIAQLETIIPRDYPDYADPSKYRFYEDRFHSSVLAELAKLPPPADAAKHQADAGGSLPVAAAWCLTCRAHTQASAGRYDAGEPHAHPDAH